MLILKIQELNAYCLPSVERRKFFCPCNKIATPGKDQLSSRSAMAALIPDA